MIAPTPAFIPGGVIGGGMFKLGIVVLPTMPAKLFWEDACTFRRADADYRRASPGVGFPASNSTVPGNRGGVNFSANDCQSSAEASSGRAFIFDFLTVCLIVSLSSCRRESLRVDSQCSLQLSLSVST